MEKDITDIKNALNNLWEKKVVTHELKYTVSK